MYQDLTRLVDGVLGENFPEGPISLDDQITVINEAVRQISMSRNERKARAANNLITWLGGLNPDVMVYGIQLLKLHPGLLFVTTDKSEARIERVRDKFEGLGRYQASNFDGINHYTWPREFADGSTFEDRFDALVEEYESEESPVDMLLSGMGVPEDLDFNQRIQLTQDAIQDITASYEKYGKLNIITDERFDRFAGWLLTVEEELALMALRSIFAIKRVQINPSNVKNWDEIKTRYEDLVLRP